MPGKPGVWDPLVHALGHSPGSLPRVYREHTEPLCSQSFQPGGVHSQEEATSVPHQDQPRVAAPHPPKPELLTLSQAGGGPVVSRLTHKNGLLHFC